MQSVLAIGPSALDIFCSACCEIEKSFAAEILQERGVRLVTIHEELA